MSNLSSITGTEGRAQHCSLDLNCDRQFTWHSSHCSHALHHTSIDCVYMIIVLTLETVVVSLRTLSQAFFKINK